MIYVTDQIPRISMLNLDGKLVGRCRGTLNGAHGMSGDAAGNLYLSELPPEKVTRLTLLLLSRSRVRARAGRRLSMMPMPLSSSSLETVSGGARRMELCESARTACRTSPISRHRR